MLTERPRDRQVVVLGGWQNNYAYQHTHRSPCTSDQAIVDHVKQLELHLKSQLDEFGVDDSLTELELEPMDKVFYIPY